MISRKLAAILAFLTAIGGFGIAKCTNKPEAQPCQCSHAHGGPQ